MPTLTRMTWHVRKAMRTISTSAVCWPTTRTIGRRRSPGTRKRPTKATVDPTDHVDEAQKWYWKATERTPHEQYELGLRSEGDPDHADETDAVFWYHFAAERGHVDAQFRIGLLTYLGVDDWHSENPSERTYWLRTAAQNGHQIAHALLHGDPEKPPTFGKQASLFPTDRSRRPNVAFPAFADEMQAESEECAREPRLLRALYCSYRRAAERACVDWASDFSTDSGIDAWYDSSKSPA